MLRILQFILLRKIKMFYEFVSHFTCNILLDFSTLIKTMYYASLLEEDSPLSEIIETAFHRADHYTRLSEHIIQTENIR